jgi:hypothetical protein
MRQNGFLTKPLRRRFQSIIPDLILSMAFFHVPPRDYNFLYYTSSNSENMQDFDPLYKQFTINDKHQQHTFLWSIFS